MTEAEWLSCDEPSQLWRSVRNAATWRKAHLFCAACVRRILTPALPEEVNALVNLIEQSADTKMDRYALGEPRMRVLEARELMEDEALRQSAMAAVNAASIELHASSQFVNSVFHDAANSAACPTTEYAIQAHLLRDVFVSPFLSLSADSGWLTSTVVALAQQMYDSRDFSAMPILADALQDAGCDNEDVLNHCRGPGPHVRGCWVVDLLLGKE